MAIQLVTFGGLNAVDDRGELDWLLGQHSRAALFIYLAVERRVSREALTSIFWPESDAENARHALREALYQLRKAVGGEWIESRAHELVVTGDIRSDAHDFTNAIERGALDAAVELYRGPFLDGVHLVDLTAWEGWVDSRRAQYARAFRKAIRELLDARHAAGDVAGAMKVAERWAARDPLDDEAQHRLIETLAAAGERTEALRQYETYRRLLEPDGLQPLDDTAALAERLRSDATPFPAVPERASRAPAPPSPSDAPLSATVTGHVDNVRQVAQPPSAIGRRSLGMIVAALLVIVMLVAPWALSRRGEQSPPSSATTIAVLPFTVHGAESVTYLGAGMVNLLGAALDGAGSMRPADSRAVFAAVAETGSAVTDRREGERVAARLGAEWYVLGDVVQAGGQLQVEAAVYHIAAGCAEASGIKGALTRCRPGEPNAKAIVNGAADSVFALVDNLAARLLSGLGDPAADRLLQTAAITTTSLTAFKAYLEGEGMMRSGQFERAADSYLSAIGLDSTFALAHYRLALAREWAPLPGEDLAAAAAARYGARLSIRDRNRLEAFRQWRAGDATQAERVYHEILVRYPDDIDAWFQLGEIEFHHGPLVGHRLDASQAAWRKVVAYEPRSLFAVTHLARLAVAGHRDSALDSLLAQFPPNVRTDRRLAEIALLRAVARGDTVTAHTVARELKDDEPLAVWRAASYLTAFGPDPGIMRGVLQELLDASTRPALRADLLWFASLLDLAGGRADASRATRTEAVQAEQAAPAAGKRSGFDPITEWFAMTLPLPYADSTLMRVRRRADIAPPKTPSLQPPIENEMGMGASLQLEPLRQYTLGILSLRLSDTASASAAAARLERLVALGNMPALVRELDRGLRARLALHAGRPEEALQLLESLESRDQQGDIAVIPFASRASERFLHGEVLAVLGRNADALEWFASLGDGSATEIPLRAPSQLRQAEIHERMGNQKEAATQYMRFVEAWRNADREFQPMVDSARQRLVELSNRHK